MKKPFYKRWWFIALVALFVIALLTPSEETAQVTKEPVKPVEAIETETKTETEDKVPKEKEKSEAELKAEAEAKAVAEEKEKADKLVAEKEYYLNEIDPTVTAQMSAYDKVWADYWVTTFEGVGNGTVSAYVAYDNMKTLKQSYDTLYNTYRKMEAPELSKDNEKLFNNFASKMKTAAMWRSEAAEKAQKMFDTGDVSPSKFDEIKNDVAYADNEMMQAAIALTSLKMELGLIEETEETTN